MRKLLVSLLVLLVLAIGADVLARRTAEDHVASRLKKTLNLSSQPDVSMSGMPFLFDLAKGEIERVEMTGERVRSEDITLDQLEVDMRRVRFSLGDVIEGSGRVRVKGGDGRATVTEANLNDALARTGAPFSVSLSPDGVTASAENGIEARGDVTLEGNALSVGGEAFPAVPLALPNLGGSVTYESIALADGRATISFTIERMFLQAYAGADPN